MKSRFRKNRKAKKGIIRKRNEGNLLKEMAAYMTAENEAFEKAGITFGKVEFICPICGGKAVGNRYQYEGYDGFRTGGLGSGCSKCGISHS